MDFSWKQKDFCQRCTRGFGSEMPLANLSSLESRLIHFCSIRGRGGILSKYLCPAGMKMRDMVDKFLVQFSVHGLLRDIGIQRCYFVPLSFKQKRKGL